MFRAIGNKATKKLDVVMINNINFADLGLYVEKDYIFTIPPLLEQIEEIYIPGKDGCLTRHKRYLNRTLTIEFKLKESSNYYKRLDYIQDVLVENVGGILTVNEEDRGFKIKRYVISNLERGKGLNRVVITFTCEPFMYTKDGQVLENR